MREYETIYVLDYTLTDSNAKAIVLKMKELVFREHGKNIRVESWGRRKLAWVRKNHTRGIYVYHHYLGMPGLVAEFERNLAIEPAVILRQTLLVNKNVNQSVRDEQADSFEFNPIRERKQNHRLNSEIDQTFEGLFESSFSEIREF